MTSKVIRKETDDQPSKFWSLRLLSYFTVYSSFRYYQIQLFLLLHSSLNIPHMGRGMSWQTDKVRLMCALRLHTRCGYGKKNNGEVTGTRSAFNTHTTDKALRCGG